MRFLHCADIHLDSPLRGLSAHGDAPAERLRGATRRAFERVVSLAIEEDTAFVVIAGDLYDGDRDDFQTAIYLQRQLHTLREAGIPVTIAYGNHDAANLITARLQLPDGVDVFPHDQAGRMELPDARAVLFGRSYGRRSEFEDLSSDYGEPEPGVLNVGVLHTALDGQYGHDPYAPCTLDSLVGHGYAYWALGHVHQRNELVRTGVHVVFPGNTCGRHINEPGSKGATVVTYEGDRILEVTHHPLAPVEWTTARIDATEAGSPAAVAELASAELARLRASSAVELFVARVQITAREEVHGRWLVEAERYEAQVRADAAGSGDDVWLERIIIEPRASGARIGEEMLGPELAARLDQLRRPSDIGVTPVELLSSLRSAFGAERAHATEMGALGLDDDSIDDLAGAAAALLAAELGEPMQRRST
jgi:DNA repair exonuclease SbcCD nuclease subunit